MRRGDEARGRFACLALIAGCGLMLAGCSSSDKFASRVDPKYGVASSPRVVDFGEPVPKGGGTYRVGKPYAVAGRIYVPEDGRGYVTEGLASWYGDDFHGRVTANGEVFDMDGISAAHPTLPMPSYVRVTNLGNHRSIIVRLNDRGPYHSNRVIDVSRHAARLLGFHGNGVARVRVEYVSPAPLEGSDDRMLMATLRHGQPAPAPSGVMVASARPFVPQYGSRGSVPVPPERPFTLGDSAGGTVAARSERQAPPASFASRWGPDTPGRIEAALAPRTLDQQARDNASAPSLSAYAPARFGTAVPTVSPSTGRNLY